MKLLKWMFERQYCWADLMVFAAYVSSFDVVSLWISIPLMITWFLFSETLTRKINK